MIEIRYVQSDDKDFWFELDRHLPEREFEKKVRDQQGYVLLEDGRPAGLLRFNLFWDNTPFCTLLFVAWEHQKKGYGRLLMEHWEAEMKEKGYGIYLLSNASRRLHQYWTGIPGHEYFDGEFVSADHRLVKPDQSIYRKFCQVFELEPRECLFIDDFPLNIEGAVTAGWQGIVFHDAEDLRQKAHAMGVRIPLRAKK